MGDRRRPGHVGPRSRQVLAQLRRFESPNVTFLAPDHSWPTVWERARGVWVWDADGRRCLDLTAAFGVAACGHAAPVVVRAGQRQMGRLLHAMGDVHPHPLKAALVRELSRITFERWTHRGHHERGRSILCNSGFEAVEAALKTTVLATGRPGVVAFEGAYHGLGHGALNATHRELFRRPFLGQLACFGSFVPFPATAGDLAELERRLQALFRRRHPGAILAEPVQGRGGIRVPPRGFLRLLRRVCDEHGALLVLDEIYTGFGRTGRWFACEEEGVVPDVICLGKALAGGFPISACVGREGVMVRAWPESAGEAWHTSTFLGHPVGCAMALAQIAAIRQLRLVARSRRLGVVLCRSLRKLRRTARGFRLWVRGRGLMVGLEVCRPDGRPATEEVRWAITRMLRRGLVVLPEGEHANVVSFTPPLVIRVSQLQHAVRALGVALLEALDHRGSPRQAPADSGVPPHRRRTITTSRSVAHSAGSEVRAKP